MGTYKLEDLEKKLDKTLKNKVTIQNGENTVIYAGEIKKICFTDIDTIRGYPSIKRYDKIKDIKKKKKLISWIPPKIKIKEIPIVRNSPIWSIPSYDIQNYCLIKDGKPIKDYRNMLKTSAINKGFQLSNQLLDAVFDPIEEKLMKILEKTKEF